MPSRLPQWRRPDWLVPLLVFLGSSAGMHLVERTFRIVAKARLADGFLFQIWTSNWTMQTMGLEDMQPVGPKALWYDHIYPPLVDSIRYLLAMPEISAGQPASQMSVDFRLYVVYTLCFGAVNTVVYLWIRDLTRSGWWALAGTVIWAISPGYLTIIMLLEASPPALAFIACAFYLLYRFLKTRRLGYSTAFFVALLLGSYTRNIAQTHVLVIVVIAFIAFWFLSTRRAWWMQALSLIVVALMFALPVKQYVMFATTDVSTYGGYQRAGMLWIDPRTVPTPAEWPANINANATTFSSRYNTQETMKDNYRLTAAANAYLVEHPVDAVRALGRSLTITVPEMLKPTSSYTENFLVDVLPWRPVYDWLFSGWRYLLLVLGSVAVVGFSRGWSGSLRLLRRYGWFLVFYALIAAPVLWSNRYYPGREDEGPIWTEAVRLKIFIEVPLYVGLVYAVWVAVGALRRRAPAGS